MKKTESLGFKCTPEIRQIIERIASQEDRTVSMQLLRIVREWLIKNGHLKEIPDKVKK